MQTLPFDVTVELDGWALFWALLESRSSEPALLRAACSKAVERVRSSMRLDTVSSHPTVAALRRLFKAAGCDPARYRPSSEALLRRILKGEEMPHIHPLVDLNNCLSACLAVPCCVMAEEKLVPPFVFRSGRPEEKYDSLRGPFHLEGKPLLVDALGPCDAPITGSERVKVSADTSRVWLVAYLPGSVVAPVAAERELADLLEAAPVAEIHMTGAT